MKRLILFYCIFFVSAVTFGQTVTKRRTVETDTLRSFTPDSALYVADTLKVTKLKLPTGTNGYVLTSDANGYLSLSASTGGISSLGGLTGATQTIALDSTYATWNINSSGTVHTFRYPGSRLGFLDRSQSWVGTNTFTTAIYGDSISLTDGSFISFTGADGGNTRIKDGTIATDAEVDITLPITSGTVALTSDILQGGRIADSSRIAFLDKTQSFTGAKTFTAATTFSNDVAFGDTIAPITIHADKSGGVGQGLKVIGVVGDPPSIILTQDGVNTGLRSGYLYHDASAYFFPYEPDGDSIALQGWAKDVIADTAAVLRGEMSAISGVSSAAYMDSTRVMTLDKTQTVTGAKSFSSTVTISSGTLNVGVNDVANGTVGIANGSTGMSNIKSAAESSVEIILPNSATGDTVMTIAGGQTITSAIWQGTDIDTTYLNITQLDGIFLKDSDTTSTVAMQWELDAKIAALGSSAYTDSTYKNSQISARIPYSDTTSVVAMQWELDNHTQPVARVTGLADSLDALRDSIDALRGDIGSGSGDVSRSDSLTVFATPSQIWALEDSVGILRDSIDALRGDIGSGGGDVSKSDSTVVFATPTQLVAYVADADTATLKSSTSATGFLSDLDWDTFNGKVSSATLTDSLDWVRDSVTALRGDIGSGTGSFLNLSVSGYGAITDSVNLVAGVDITLSQAGNDITIALDTSQIQDIGISASTGALAIWRGTDSLGNIANAVASITGLQDSLNARVSVADTAFRKATTSTTGFLSDLDWDTFTAKVSSATLTDTAAAVRDWVTAQGYGTGTGTGTSIYSLDASFTTTATKDTVTWSGAHTYDSYQATPYASSADDSTGDVLMVYPDTNRVIVSRKFGGTSGLNYNLHRIAGTLAPPTAFNATQGADSARLAVSWTAPATSTSATARPIDSIAITWSKSAYPASVAAAGDSVKRVIKTTTSDTLTGLTPSTLYYIRAFSETYKHEYNADTSSARDTCTTSAGTAGGGSVALNSCVVDSAYAESGTFQFSHTAAGSNRYLVAFIGGNNVSGTGMSWRCDSIKYDGVKMTPRDSATGFWNAQSFTLVAPSTTTNADVDVYCHGFSDAAYYANFHIAILSFTGVDQSNGVDDSEIAAADGNPSVTLTTTANGMAVGMTRAYLFNANVASAGSGETSRFNNNGGVAGRVTSTMVITEPASSTSTTLGPTSSGNTRLLSVSLKPAS